MSGFKAKSKVSKVEYNDSDGGSESDSDSDNETVSTESEESDEDADENASLAEVEALSEDDVEEKEDADADEDEDEDEEDNVQPKKIKGGTKEDYNDDEEDENVIVQSNTNIINPVAPVLDSDDEDDEMDESYLQKFNASVNKNYVMDFHPECTINNYDEIVGLTKIIRDTENNIIDDLHKTLPYLTKYERARVLGQRAKQINSGAKVFVKVPETVIDGYLIAEMELAQKRIPFIIRRPTPGGGCEYWNLRDLELIQF
jgi:DNA-directed RNA polymerase subunit K/omega